VIEQTEITLDLDQLENGELGLVWGLTSSVSKDGDGNPLLTQLAAAFGEEYALRTGKLSLLPNTEHDFEFNFEQYSVNDLKNAFFHFAALSAAFETNDKRSSAKFCSTILVLISNALDSHSDAGHA
jgi:hypothetical protein